MRDCQTRSLLLLVLLLALATTASAHRAAHAPLFRLDNDAIASDLDFDFELDLDTDTRDDEPHRSRFEEIEIDALSRSSDVGATTTKQPLGLDNIAPQTFSFGRGIGYVATTRVHAHEPLFAIPLSQVMSLETAQRGRIRVLLDANPELPPAIALALHVLEEHALGPHSNFTDLLATLPAPQDARTALNNALFYTRTELELLEGSQLLRVVTARTNALEHYFDALVEPLTSADAVDPPLFTRDVFTRAHFYWALGVVWTHAFPLSVGSGSDSDIVLAPVLSTVAVCVDSAQCSPSRIERDAQTQQLVVYAATDYKAGDDVALFVGDKSSTMLMVSYGITRPMASTLDQVDISIVLEPNDPLADVKAFLLSAYNMSMNESYALSAGVTSLPDRVVASLKIKLLSGNEVARVQHLFEAVATRSADKTYSEPRHVVSLRNEFVFTRALVATCTNMLKQYRTTLEDDEQRLQELENEREASRELYIRRMLMIEKQALHDTIALVKQQWADLVLSDHPNLLRIDE